MAETEKPWSIRPGRPHLKQQTRSVRAFGLTNRETPLSKARFRSRCVQRAPLLQHPKPRRPPEAETFPELRRSHSCTPDLPKAELCAIVTGVVTKLCAAPTSPTALILNLFCNSNKSKLSFPERSHATQSCMQLQSSVLKSGQELLSRARSFLFLSNFSQSEPEPHYWPCGKGSKGGLACSIKGGRRGWK